MRRAAIVLAGLTIARLVVAAFLPLTPDEAYYWTWSHALAAGYVDHPPMVALWIRAGTALFGQTALGVRLLGPVAAALGTAMLADAAERAFPARHAGVIAGALWNATLFVGAGAATMTPDTPLLFFWCATIWAGVRIAGGGAPWWWLVAGLTAGAALTSKYTAVFLWFGIGVWVLLAADRRRWLRSPFPWLGAVLGFATFLPVLVWNAEHGWVSVLRQGGRVGDWQPARAIGFLGELIGGQIGLATPGVFLLCVAGVVGLVRGSRHGSPGERSYRSLLLWLTIPPVLVFIQHAFGDRVQGNWPVIVYPAAVLAVSGALPTGWQRWVWPSVGLGFALAGLVLLHALTGFLPLPVAADPGARQLAGWADLTAAANGLRARENATYVVAEEYALTSELAWHAPAGLAVVGIDPRVGPMDLPRLDMAGRTGILIRAEHRWDEIDPVTWASAVPLGFLDRVAAGGTVERYRVWRVVGRVPGVAMPGRGLPSRGFAVAR